MSYGDHELNLRVFDGEDTSPETSFWLEKNDPNAPTTSTTGSSASIPPIIWVFGGLISLLAGCALLLAYWRGSQPVITSYLDIKQFEYPVDRIIPQLIDDEIPELKPESTWILFVRSPESQHVLTKRIKYSTQLLIGLCQNGETVGTVLDKLACTLKVPSKQQLAFETECCSFLNALAKEGIVAFI